MKKLNYLFFAIVFLTLVGVTSLKAQTNPSHVYHVATWYIIDGQDSVARAERNAVLEEYLTKVTMKNEFVIHQWTMNHFFTDDSREFVTITEYATLADIEKAFNRDGELEKQAWPDQKKRDDFNKKMAGYFTHHKDAIFSGLPKLSK
jgi:hypothetical protein